MEQPTPAAKVPTQLSVSAKSEAFVPPIMMPVMLSGVDSLFVTVTVWDALVMPITWFENDKLEGRITTNSYNSALATFRRKIARLE
jgi:hypothetical protein